MTDGELASPAALLSTARELNWRRVYIFPTRHGFTLGALLLVILLGAINYDNALAYLLCFLLGGLFLIAMLHTYANLAGLKIGHVHVEPVFAGEPAEFEVRLVEQDGRPRFHLHLGRLTPGPHAWWKRTPTQATDHVARLTADSVFTLSIATTKRGRLPLRRLRLHSVFPLGVLTTGAYLDTSANCLVYPAPRGVLPLPFGAGQGHSDEHGQGLGADEFESLKPYRAGDSLRAVAWPAFARQGELLVKHFQGRGGATLGLTWEAVQSLPDTEARLAQLAQWVLHAERSGMAYSLSIPGCELPSGRGAAQRTRALEALALFSPYEHARTR